LFTISLVRFCGHAADAAGVRVSNEIPASAFERLAQKNLLLAGEKVIAYYDATISGDGSEVAMVTSERLVYFKNGRTTAFPLGDITDVRHHSETLTGDVIEAESQSGEAMKIEIANGNDGPVFLAKLEAGWKKKRPPAAPAESPKP
jgi:hypothetical protein